MFMDQYSDPVQVIGKKISHGTNFRDDSLEYVVHVLRNIGYWTFIFEKQLLQTCK